LVKKMPFLPSPLKKGFVLGFEELLKVIGSTQCAAIIGNQRNKLFMGCGDRTKC